MFKRLILCFFIATMMIQTNLSQSDCPLAPRLVVGDFAQVLPGQSNNVRVDPSRDATRLGVIPAGGIFEVLEGPVCADGLQWWHVRYNMLDGWTVEGGEGVYWLEHLTAPEPVSYTKELVFIQSGKFDLAGIYYLNLDDLEIKPLAGAGSIGRVSSMTWFPDGQSLAYIFFGHGGEGTPGRLAIRSLGAEDHTVFPDFYVSWLIGVSPDGQKIAYNSEGVSLYDIQSGQSELIPNTEGKAFMVWSPDGTQILTQTYDPPRITQIYSVAGTEEPQTITTFADLGMPVVDLDWSPDGNYLAMTVIENGQDFRLVIYELATERWFFVTDPELSVQTPDWSLDGTEIAFSGRVIGEERSLYIYNLFDGTIQRITQGVDEFGPLWRPVPGITPVNIGILFQQLYDEYR